MKGKAEQARLSGLGRSLGRFALATGVALTLAGGSVVPAVARAEEAGAGTGTFTIDRSLMNEKVTYKGYQIFGAKVTAGKGLVRYFGDITWANDDVKAAVEGVIKAEDPSYAGKTAQDAAVWIKEHVTGVTRYSSVSADSVANKIAVAVMGKTASATVDAGSSVTVAQGYWLFVTDQGSTNGKTETEGSAPIFTVVDAGETKVTEKVDFPSFEKRVVSDSDDDSVPVSDAEVGQEVKYRLNATMPYNLGSYKSYYLEFDDVLPKGLAYVGNPKVTLNHLGSTPVDVSGGFKISQAKNADGTTKVTAVCEDVKALKGIDKDSTISLEYGAKLTSDAAIGGNGNDNSATITYSNNPNTTSRGTSVPEKARLHTFRIQMSKVDAATKRPLAGAEFTVKATNPDDSSSRDLYVGKDGTLSTTAYAFRSDENGMIDVPGVDSGTYTFHELRAPTAKTGSYDKVGDFTVTVKADYGGPEAPGRDPYAIYRFTGSVSGDGVTGGIDADGDGTIEQDVDNEKTADASTGTVRLTVGNKLKTEVPVTGRQGIVAATAAGLVIVTVSAAAVARRRNGEREQDER